MSEQPPGGHDSDTSHHARDPGGSEAHTGTTSVRRHERSTISNGDFTPNSAANPAAAGSEMRLYVGGVGNANPPSQDGHVNGQPFAPPALPVQLLWFGPQTGGGEILPLLFAGVAGMSQIDFTAPSASGGAEFAQVLGPDEFGASGFLQIYVKQ